MKQGVDLVVIKELLGHAPNVVSADVYAHASPRLQRQAIGTLRTVTDAPDAPPTPAAGR
ncbi:hypothetical protein [Streptomyces sp. NBC_00829]|uniref:hypothetical protein n=1 Tax=Streptomyces sp. NBC_00829 TaxID=2903679 RepID=UPI00386D28D2